MCLTRITRQPATARPGGGECRWSSASRHSSPGRSALPRRDVLVASWGQRKGGDDMKNEVSRRRFLQFAAVSVGAAGVGGTGYRVVAGASPMGGGSGAPTRNALRIPPSVAPQTTLAAQAARVDLGGGHLSDVLAYNGSVPGPTFQVDSGGPFAVTLDNKLTDATTIHWHGLVVPTVADGQPHEAIPTH